MPEVLLHYIWYKGLFSTFDQFTDDGQMIEIVNRGEHNTDAGPDFVNVRLRLRSPNHAQSIDLVGNVEIHICSSDWYKHNHHKDTAYDNVILHVVKKIDRKVFNSQGVEIPQCQLQYVNDKDYLFLLLNESQQTNSPFWTHLCSKYVQKSPALLSSNWRNELCNERLECKKQSILKLIDITNGKWQEAFYISLAHYFGFHINSIPFEQLAIQTPLHVLQAHKTNLFQLVAILLGQSGMLTPNATTTVNLLGASTTSLLYNEYCKWQNVYNLEPLPVHIWKHARIHPNNSPEIRIIQFAKLYNNENTTLLESIFTNNDCEQIKMLFEQVSNPSPSGFSQFLSNTPHIGKEGILTLMINVAIPYKYAHGDKEIAVKWLQTLPAENNTIIRKWKLLGQTVVNAFDTQALLHLYMKYCQPQNCLQCDVAHQIFLNNKKTLI